MFLQMIHLLLTSDALIRDSLVQNLGLHPHASHVQVYQKEEKILVYSEDISSLLEKAIEEYAPDNIWYITPGFIISPEHTVGDIVLPNTFLSYDPKVGETEFTKENQDSFLHDALFLDHYEAQNDIDFEHFGLSIGGIHVSMPSYDESLHEAIEFAYSADSTDIHLYNLVLQAKKLERDAKFFGVVALIGSSSNDDEKKRVYTHTSEVLRYLQTGDIGDEFEEDDNDDTSHFDDEDTDISLNKESDE